MSDDEVFVMFASGAVAITGFVMNFTRLLRPQARRDNPGLGLVRLAVLLGLGWIVFVLATYADPSIKGIYNYFYLLMGLAAILMFGETGARMYGVNVRIDVGERRNWAAAVFLAAFMLGTGLIFGGSLWGEADPTGGGDEGGWWIPLGFFLLGWGVMVIGLALYCWREPGRFRQAIRQDRDVGAVWGAASYTLSTAILMTDAVSGDFFGWGAGLKDVGIAAGMLFAHELLRLPVGVSDANRKRRWIETVVYFGLAGLNAAWRFVK
ncbi:MAG: hypothetical protein A3K19_19210 [Lentisphaerae bacterium RIFOXYB12_FULL_65_16]|nr:MAG: hypothetical protein A3K18_02250 [Lentisphaerae bacterium RIFOXYA12_64_32]OGV91584.1 MAG: hypothetical protein A3K19_19210 [Lentisphaerae bacterium RIFOXYB12_FULL_65_16]